GARGVAACVREGRARSVRRLRRLRARLHAGGLPSLWRAGAGAVLLQGPGFCPSCLGRRMAEGAALLVDEVLPPVGYRQWVLTFEGSMAVRLGYDSELLCRVSRCFAHRVSQHVRRAVKRHHGLPSMANLQAGVLSVVQRFRADLGLFVHLHDLVTDGAFAELEDGSVK